MQGVVSVTDMSDVDFFAGGQLLKEWVVNTGGELVSSHGMQRGSAALLSALQQVPAIPALCWNCRHCCVSTRVCP